MSIRRCPILFVLTALLVLSSTSAAAQDVTTATITEGKVYWVTRSDGSEIKGFITGRSPADVRVSGAFGEVSIPTGEVLTIAKVDGLKNGFLIGAGVGLAFMVPYALSDEGSADTGPKLMGALGVAAMYGGIGALIDKALEGRTVVYRRSGGPSFVLVPIASGQRLGLRGSVRW